MPAALERKLKKEANKEGIKGKHKDAYVYGTLRKTGWKPKKEMHAMDKVTYLQSINSKLETCFDYGDDERRRSALGTVGLVGAGAGAGVGGVLGHQAIKSAGGYGANMTAAKYGYGAAIRNGMGPGLWTPTPGGKLGAAAGSGVSSIKKLLAKIVKPAAEALSSKSEEIRFDDDYHPHKIERAFLGNPLSTLIHGKKGQRIGGFGEAKAHMNANMLGGAGIVGAVGAGLGAGIGALGGRGRAGAKVGALIGGGVGAYTGAVGGQLRATYGKTGEKNYKQRTYGMSSRHTKLIELNSRIDETCFAGGYINTKEGVRKERGVGPHFNRNAGVYIGTGLAPGAGTALGALVDSSRRKQNKLITKSENPNSSSFAKGKVY